MKETLLLLIIGIAMTAISVVWLVLYIKHRLSCSEKVQATVVGIEYKRHMTRDKSHVRYVPIFAYTVDGKEYEAKSDKEMLSKLKYHEGASFVIRYNPNNPNTICVGVKAFSSFLSVIFTVSGIITIICAFL